MYPKEVRETFSKKEIKRLKSKGYSDRDLVGLAFFKRTTEMGLTEEEMDKILLQSLTETIEEHYGSEAAEELKGYTSLNDLIK